MYPLIPGVISSGSALKLTANTGSCDPNISRTFIGRSNPNHNIYDNDDSYNDNDDYNNNDIDNKPDDDVCKHNPKSAVERK